MASRTGLMPVKVKAEVKTKWQSTISAREPFKAAPSRKTGLTNVKMRTVDVKPFPPPKHKLVSTTMTSNVSKNALPVASKAIQKPGLAAKSKTNMRNSHAGFIPVDRGLPKHATPSRKSFVAGQRTPKSILKREPVAPNTGNKSAQTVACPDSHHVKFKSKATDQAAMRAKLNAWLEAKGKTQSACHCRHLMCFDVEMSTKKKCEVLVDRTLSQNVLSQQMKVLNNEAVKKKLFKVEMGPLPNPDKENSPQDGEHAHQDGEHTYQDGQHTYQDGQHTYQDAADKNDNATTMKEEGDRKTEGGNPFLVQDSLSLTKENVLDKIQFMLEECLNLFTSGCPLENILPLLAELEVNMPEALTLATYYVYKAKIVAAFPQMVLDVYCEAVKNNAQPCDLLATEMKSIFSKWLLPVNESTKTQIGGEHQPGQKAPDTESLESIETDQSVVFSSSCRTPRETGDKREPTVRNLGSTIKYSIGSAKPLVRQSTEHSTRVPYVTPVRRSIRMSGMSLTPSTELRREVNSVSDLSSLERQSMLFKVNPAITGN